jgi:hypothetical protein
MGVVLFVARIVIVRAPDYSSRINLSQGMEPKGRTTSSRFISSRTTSNRHNRACMQKGEGRKWQS